MLCPLFSHATYLKYMIWTCFNIWNCTPSGVLSKDSEASPCWDKPGFQTNQDLGMGETWWNDVWVPKGPTVHIFSIFWPIVTTHYCQQWTDLPRKHLVVDPCLQYHACRGMNIYHQKKMDAKTKNPWALTHGQWPASCCSSMGRHTSSTTAAACCNIVSCVYNGGCHIWHHRGLINKPECLKVGKTSQNNITILGGTLSS